MEKENRIPLPRRRSGSDGPAPTALATSAQTASDDGAAGGDARPGQDEEGKTGSGPDAGHGGMGSAEARPGLGGAGERVGASSGLPRRVRGMSDGPRPPAQVARRALPASFLERVRAAYDDGGAGSDARPGQDEEGKTGNGPDAGRGGMGSAEARPGLGGAGERVGASSGLPRRVRGMSDGPRPPAQVARPALPASFLERVRAAAEAEQRLEERAQEHARQPAEPAAAQPGPSRLPARFVRSRDWMARNTDKKERAGGDQPEPGPQNSTAGDQAGTARPAMASVDLWTARGGAEPDQARTPAASSVLGTDGASAAPPEVADPTGPAGPGAPPALPRRKPRVSHRRDPAQAGPVAAVSTAGPTGEPLNRAHSRDPGVCDG